MSHEALDAKQHHKPSVRHYRKSHHPKGSDFTDKYVVETPNKEDYRGFLKLDAPKVTLEDLTLLGNSDDPETKLDKIY